jgi:hypothetical protein
MKKFLPIIIVAGVVIVGGILAYLYLGKGGLSLPSMPGEVGKEEGESGEEFVGQIKDVIARGVPMKCTYSQDNTTGNSYIKGEQMYGEIDQAGKTVYVIIKDNCMWSWNQDETQGAKMCFEEDYWEMSEEEVPEGQTGVPSEAEYHCSPAIINDSQFNPPSGINFIDLTEVMPSGVEE